MSEGKLYALSICDAQCPDFDLDHSALLREADAGAAQKVRNRPLIFLVSADRWFLRAFGPRCALQNKALALTLKVLAGGDR